MSFKAVSKSIGCSDPSIVGIAWSYNMLGSDSCVDDVKDICWSVVCNEEQSDAALDTFGNV
jgi:hypothetical protein